MITAPHPLAPHAPDGATLWYEHVKEHGWHPAQVMSSNIHEATVEEIALAAELAALGKCPHCIVYDTPGWMYDARTCATCGEGLGTV